MMETKLVESDLSSSEEQKTFIVVGIPAYNEEQSIGRIVLEAKKFAAKVLVCDDGSTDCTADVAERYGADVIRHSSNVGYGAALQSLFKGAQMVKADILVTIDGDGQHNTEEIPRLITPIINGECDVVVGSRFIDKIGTVEMPKYRQFGVKIITKLVNGSAKNGVSDAQSGFRAYNARALDCLFFTEMGMGASIEALLQLKKFNLKFSEVPVSCKYKDNAGTKTSTKHPLAHGVSLILSIIKLVVEEKPLVLLGLPGIVFLILGLIFGVQILQIYATVHQIVTNLAIVSFGFILIGFFLTTNALTLYAIRKVSEKVRY